MLIINYCEICIHEVSIFGEFPACILETLITRHLKNQDIILIETSRKKKNPGEIEIVKFLELKGFVVTTEYDQDRVLVKPTGMLERIDKDYLIFCSKSGKHD